MPHISQLTKRILGFPVKGFAASCISAFIKVQMWVDDSVQRLLSASSSKVTETATTDWCAIYDEVGVGIRVMTNGSVRAPELVRHYTQEGWSQPIRRAKPALWIDMSCILRCFSRGFQDSLW